MNEFHLIYFYFLNEFKLKYGYSKIHGKYVAVTGRRNDLLIHILYPGCKIATVMIIEEQCSVVVNGEYFDLNDPHSIRNILRLVDNIVLTYINSA